MLHRRVWGSFLPALVSCSLSVSYDGSSYSCEDGVCPSGWVCGSDDYCRLAAPPPIDAGGDDSDGSQSDGDPPVPPEACSDEDAVPLSDGGCLVLHRTPRTYQDAVDRCTSDYGGYIAVLTSDEEQAALDQLRAFQIRDVWIGLDDRDEEGTFVWLSGDALELDYWAPGEPNNGDSNQQGEGEEDCVAAKLDLDNRWDDRPCEAYYAYVCEHEPEGE